MSLSDRLDLTLFVNKSLFEKRCKSSEIVQKLCLLHFVCLFCIINRVLPFCDDFIVNMLMGLLILNCVQFIKSAIFMRPLKHIIFCLLSFRYQFLEQWDATNANYFVR